MEQHKWPSTLVVLNTKRTAAALMCRWSSSLMFASGSMLGLHEAGAHQAFVIDAVEAL